MGVPGLWEFVKDAGQQRALTHLTVVDGFEKNKSSKRAYRIGIDLSIWYSHAAYSREGENPQLRLIFFRLRQLSELPILPLFVFDGRQRPKVKRGSKMGKSGSHPLNKPVKEMLDAFGMEWREAKGEAEAELAYLSCKGYIDAILTDDCDALVFGARTIINNWSATLSGNRSNPGAQQNSSSSKKKPQVTIYTSEGIHRLGLSRGDLILYALLSGGDYHNGVDGFGPKFSFGLARCGFGDALLKVYEENRPHIQPFLTQWRNDINRELATNSRGFLPPRAHVLIPNDFPDLNILKFYANPVRSGQEGTRGGGPMRDKGELDLGRLAKYCEQTFEWGYAPAIVKRFRDLLWPSAVMHVLRRAALEADDKERAKRVDSGIEDRSIRFPLKPSRAEGVGTPAFLVRHALAPPDKSTQNRNDQIAAAFVNRGLQASRTQTRREDIPDPHPLISKVVGTRNNASTGGLLEYRIEVSPIQLVAFTRAGLTGSRPEPNPPPNPPKKPPPHPDSILRLWVPGSILHQVHPGLVEDYVMKEEAKKNKTPRARGKRKAATPEEEEDDEDGEDDGAQGSSPAAPPRRAPVQVARELVSGTASPVPPAARYPELGQNHAVLDPWFAASDGHSIRFLFTFPNPDKPDFAEEEAESHIPLEHDDVLLNNKHTRDDAPRTSFDALCDQILDGRGKKSKAKKPPGPNVTNRALNDDMVLDNMHSPADDDEAPRNSFDALCDQILDGRGKKAKAKKAREPKRTKGAANPATALPRIHASDPLVTKLDKLGARQAAKRRKVSDQDDGGGAIAVAAISAFPILPELSHPHRSSFASSSRPWNRTIPAPLQQRRTPHQQRTSYSEPSSSQDSRLSSRDDNILDLTL